MAPAAAVAAPTVAVAAVLHDADHDNGDNGGWMDPPLDAALPAVAAAPTVVMHDTSNDMTANHLLRYHPRPLISSLSSLSSESSAITNTTNDTFTDSYALGRLMVEMISLTSPQSSLMLSNSDLCDYVMALPLIPLTFRIMIISLLVSPSQALVSSSSKRVLTMKLEDDEKKKKAQPKQSKTAASSSSTTATSASATAAMAAGDAATTVDHHDHDHDTVIDADQSDDNDNDNGDDDDDDDDDEPKPRERRLAFTSRRTTHATPSLVQSIITTMYHGIPHHGHGMSLGIANRIIRRLCQPYRCLSCNHHHRQPNVTRSYDTDTDDEEVQETRHMERHIDSDHDDEPTSP
jgi:hypothetical protein